MESLVSRTRKAAHEPSRSSQQPSNKKIRLDRRTCAQLDRNYDRKSETDLRMAREVKDRQTVQQRRTLQPSSSATSFENKFEKIKNNFLEIFRNYLFVQKLENACLKFLVKIAKVFFYF